MSAEKIEFRCLHCDRLLRVAAIHQGKRLVCPGCANESQVPEEPGAEDGQYSWEDESASQDSAFVIWDPQSVSLSEIFRDTWQLYIQNLWLLLGVALVDILFYLVGIVIIMIPTVLAMWMLVTMVQFGPELAGLCGLFLGGLGFLTLVNYMMCRHASFFMKIARGEQYSFREALRVEFRSESQTLLPLIFGVIVGIGLLMLVVPGVYVYLMMWPYLWIWADRQTPDRPVDAFPLSQELTKRNLSASLAITLLVFVGSFVGQAEIFTGSFIRLLKAVAYLKMSGQPVGGRRH